MASGSAQGSIFEKGEEMKIDGFLTSAVAAGIKYQNRLDLGLIYSEEPAVTAGVFTTNRVVAAPLVLDIERLKQGRAQAILVNSGCANACTGEQGHEACLQTGGMVARSLGIPDDMVLLSSTGVIGSQLNVDAVDAAMPALVEGLSPDRFNQVATAIMTTDTVRKTVTRTVTIGGRDVKFMAMAKGSGMIMPNMATMLSFVLTDAQISFVELQRALRAAVAKTLNRITVDGDTSTNDMVLIMANGKAGNPWIEDERSADYRAFTTCLTDILHELAMMIVADGEGATKCITIRICGAREEADALQIGRTVANSSLVKTAFFGEDANWGRIFAAMGRSGVKFDPETVDIMFDDVLIVRNGQLASPENEKKADLVLKRKNICVTIDMKAGSVCEEFYTCDFSLDYVRINSDYRS